MPASWISAGSSTEHMLRDSLVEHLQEAVERQRLAAAGRPRDEHEPVRRADRGFDDLALCRASRPSAASDKIRRAARRAGAARAFRRTASAASSRDSLRSCPCASGEPQPAVLRHAPLGNVHARQHLHARDERITQMRRRRGHFVQHAVHPQAECATRVPRARCGYPKRRAPRACAQVSVRSRDGGRVVGCVGRSAGRARRSRR